MDGRCRGRLPISVGPLGSAARRASVGSPVGWGRAAFGRLERTRRDDDRSRRDRLLPRLPAVLPALVGPGSHHANLVTRIWTGGRVRRLEFATKPIRYQ